MAAPPPARGARWVERGWGEPGHTQGTRLEGSATACSGLCLPGYLVNDNTKES